MAIFEISGVDRQTGQARSRTIVANSEREAILEAGENGLAVSKVRLVRDAARPNTGVTCPDCGQSRSASAVTCPHCGKLNVVGKAGRVACPACASTDVSTSFRPLYIVAAILFFPLGLLVLLLPKVARCRRCAHRFDAPGMRLA